MNSSQTTNIERLLGELLNETRSLRRDFERDRVDAKESRTRVYNRVERLEESIEITAKVAAQAREASQKNTSTIDKEIKPQTDRLKNLGVKGGGFLAGAALMGGLVSAPIVQAVVAALEKLSR
ncbi:hypothetical protein MXMO3_01838 [Maritalea myrionectae]|uniref:Uncharacterized protein n=1 Tax=Maritalea myrionectae TaxID=454601 RepID=A0A2R4MEF7_9HYPH|nr:hypothetical protein [Maritalea myrionectae]AVX04363.1 hypothetical protein MXMO3_01838 [Maritalea myrionectae]